MKANHWLLASLLVAGSAHAVPQYGPMPGPGMGPGGPGPYMAGPGRGPQMAHPGATLRAGMDKLLGYLSTGERPSAEALAAFLDSEIAPFFDFEYMTESAGGRLYDELGADERQAMVEEIKRSFLGTMAEKLAGYDDQQVRFMAPRPGNDGRTAQVSVAVLNSGSYPARLDFRMYRNGDKWLVYDVAANGQSAIVHYRNQLMRQLQHQRMQQMRRMARPMGPAMMPGRGMGYGPGPGPRQMR